MFVVNQVIGIIFILAMLYLTFLFYKRNSYTKTAYLLWSVAWVIAGVLLVFANNFQDVTKAFGFARTTDLFVAAALMFFGAITFFNYTAVKRSERKVEDLVRQLALRKK